MSDFLKSSPAIDAAVNESTNFEQMREAILQKLAAQGTVVRTNAYGVRVIPQTPEPGSVSLPANPPAQDTCLRVIYPGGNNRFEIYGASEQELDEKEQQIRAMFSGSKIKQFVVVQQLSTTEKGETKMSDITPSSLGETFDADFEAKVAACSTAAEISELMKNRSVAVGLTRRDLYSPDILLPVEPGTQPRGFAKTVVINGVKHIIEGATEQELLANENALYRAQFEPATTTEHTDPTRDERGRFVADDPTARIESDLVARALQAQGTDPSALREFSAQREQNNWADAVEDFKEIHKDWVGGEDNKNLIGQIIIENPTEFEDLTPLQSLEKAYQHAVQNDLLVETPELQTNRKLLEANSPAEILEALGRNSTSLFGR